MKWMTKLTQRLSGLYKAVARFPLTTLFLLAAAIVNANNIGSGKDVSKFLLTCVVGAMLSAVAQTVFERFFAKWSSRLSLMTIVVLLTAGYYLILMNAPKLGMEIDIKTAVALFALLISFIWVPVIKSPINFNQSFMISFKSLFVSLFFSGVIFAGVSMILFAFDQLITTIDQNAFPHAANLVFTLFAPMYFLSLIPVYHGNNHSEEVEKASSSPKFLTILISYIVIPLIAVFTLILVAYIVKNIGGKFWTDNLLEPMLVSYSITVILVYILASEIDNKFTLLFRRVFPKLLVPIVSFQIASSIISVTESGITHTRYFVILFGIFAVITGILLSVIPVRKNGLIAPILLVFALVSILPPVDAFTVSRISQSRMLEQVLVKNDMLKDNQVVPKDSIPDQDKKKITNAVQYLNMMNYTKKLAFLPKDFNFYEDFRDTFGFGEYNQPDKFNNYTFIAVKQPTPLRITGHDFFIQMDLSGTYNNGDERYEIEKSGQAYILLKDVSDGKVDIKLLSNDNKEVIVFHTDEIFDKFSDYQGENIISTDEATFTEENGQAKLTVFLQSLDFQRDTHTPGKSAMAYVFVQIK
ncbi:DUF4153 domain-containing protein [Neobacillus sp. Marseille-QA0830]